MYVCICNIVSKIRRYIAINHSSSHFEKKKKKVKKNKMLSTTIAGIKLKTCIFNASGPRTGIYTRIHQNIFEYVARF
jgi:hypothetical protein